MEQRNSRKYRGAYIEGNAVRRSQAAPKRQPERQKTREQLEQERIKRQYAKRNQQKELSMNRGYVAFLTVATAICFSVCLVFVHVQSDINTRMSNIASLETQISNLKADNTAAQKRLDTTMNLDEVKEAASEMGLSYPTDDQIQYYTVESKDYMNQYGDIPSN
jgi:cell division protein FtsL